MSKTSFSMNLPPARGPRQMIEAGRYEIASVWAEFISDSGAELWSEVLIAVYLAMKAREPEVLRK
jgi:hypothetical protein